MANRPSPARERASKSTETRRPYCLTCYDRDLALEGATATCRRCGSTHVRIDLAKYWTREPELLNLERFVKGVIVLFLIAIWWMLLFPPHGVNLGTGQGWAVGFPILVGYVLWETASKITQKKPYFNARLVWILMPPSLVVLPLALVGLLAPSHLPGALGVALLIGLPLLAVSAIAWFLGLRLERWKRERIARGLRRREANLAPD